MLAEVDREAARVGRPHALGVVGVRPGPLMLHALDRIRVADDIGPYDLEPGPVGQAVTDCRARPRPVQASAAGRRRVEQVIVRRSPALKLALPRPGERFAPRPLIALE